MTATNHAITGAIIGALLPTPLAPIIALASHFLLDILPHFGNSDTVKPYTKSFILLLVIDALLCIGIVIFGWFFAPDKWLIMGVSAFCATAPDILWLLEGKVRWLRGYFRFAKRIQWGEMPEGWTYELFYFAVMCVVLVTVV